MKVTVAISIIVLLLLTCISADWLDGDIGVDRRYGDLPNMPIPFESTQTAADCAKMCMNNTDCLAWAYCTPNCGGDKQPSCYLKGNVTAQSSDPCRVSGVKKHILVPLKFTPLPVSTIKPVGWLKQQLQVQAAGLSGHLSLFWADVENSSWVGGTADGGLHERTPYWLNGFVPLAFQLEDPDLISMVNKYISYILAHQTEDGWLGADDIKDGNAYWSKYPMLFTLRQYYEATKNTMVITAMHRFIKTAHTRMLSLPFGSTWSGARWQDLVLSVHWLLENHPNGNEQLLWDIAELAHQQGFDWRSWYTDENFPKDSVTRATLYTHGVNNGQAIKSEGVWYRQSNDSKDYNSSYERMRLLDTYHGLPSGIFACDEHLAGNMPSRGSELCTVVESMYSYEVLYSVTGDTIFAERAEMLAYNALPATITPDMWAHQYLQQPNEMNAVHSDDHVWAFDGPDSTLYGLAPNYGCCTANFNQGWPKFTQNLVMTTQDGGLTVAMYSPVSVQTKSPTGGTVILEINTDYPFDEHVTINVNSEEESLPVYFRVPSWAVGATFSVNGGNPQPATSGSHFKVVCSKASTKIEAIFPMKLNVTRRYNNAASIYYGPLLYGLQIDEEFKILHNYSFDSKDYQVTPGSPWNYVLVLRNDSKPEDDLKFISTGLAPDTKYPFSSDSTPSYITAMGCKLDSWELSHNAAAAPPTSPVASCSGDWTSIKLLPFGATNLRMAEMPTTEK